MTDFTPTQTATIAELIKTYKAMETELEQLPKVVHFLSSDEEKAAFTPEVAARRNTLALLMQAAKAEVGRIEEAAFQAMSDDYRAGDA